ncbi:hypothetical protein BDV95DRAFT_144901 [Massariosphaeria phaeospora]|uniref:Uncharacterized protein n=1 Tax=Massariosphaeria phaeospora TaxID=100035 RepID=A0A7C8IEJ3_9PLEO|nr:hypothetical protein BDV95DRAFT_144901 [Massariosphaeria phaeospora]
MFWRRTSQGRVSHALQIDTPGNPTSYAKARPPIHPTPQNIGDTRMLSSANSLLAITLRHKRSSSPRSALRQPILARLAGVPRCFETRRGERHPSPSPNPFISYASDREPHLHTTPYERMGPRVIPRERNTGTWAVVVEARMASRPPRFVCMLDWIRTP